MDLPLHLHRHVTGRNFQPLHPGHDFCRGRRLLRLHDLPASHLGHLPSGRPSPLPRQKDQLFRGGHGLYRALCHYLGNVPIIPQKRGSTSTFPGKVGGIMSEQEKDPDLKIKLGQNNEIKIKNKYETFSIANDIAISVVFILGSVLTLAGLSMVATVFYLLGSLGMAARPAIRLKRRTHLQRIGADANTAESYDY